MNNCSRTPCGYGSALEYVLAYCSESVSICFENTSSGELSLLVLVSVTGSVDEFALAASAGSAAGVSSVRDFFAGGSSPVDMFDYLKRLLL